MYIDLRKAFDTVNHHILLKKLKILGVANTNFKWFENYLQERKQCTFAKNICSNKSVVECGVPQHYLYADDTVIFITGTNTADVVNKLQVDLTRYSSWCQGNKLIVNTKKSNYVVYGTKSKVSNIQNLKLELNGDNLVRVPYYKYLGVFLDSSLSFNKHIDVSKKLICHKLYLLSKIRKHINEYTSTQIFQTMIAPLIDYGDIVYSGTSTRNLDKLQSLQNRGLRICANEIQYISPDALHQ